MLETIKSLFNEDTFIDSLGTVVESNLTFTEYLPRKFSYRKGLDSIYFTLSDKKVYTTAYENLEKFTKNPKFTTINGLPETNG